MPSLTDLEAVVLGLLWKSGGATAYAVRRRLEASPAARFSASAGAVYPLVRRLARRRLISGTSERVGKRRGTRWTCSAAGRAALRAWLAVPQDPAELTTADPLRTRLFFLAALSAKEQHEWLELAEEAARAQVARLEQRLAQDRADRWLALAHRNALLQAQATVVWLGEVRALVTPA